MSQHLDERRDLIPLATGLLDDRTRDVRAHLEMCTACRERWHHLLAGRESSDDGVRHLPAAMVARWDRARRELRGVERVLVRAHLQRCPDCREELTALGHEPELAAADVVTLAGAGSRPRRRWLARTAAASLAAAAVLVVVVVGPFGDRAAPEQPSGLIPWAAPRLLRGGAAEAVTVPADTRSLSLLVGVPLAIDPQRPALLEVRSPAGEVMLELEAAPVDLERGTLVVLLQSAESLPLGEYTVTVSQGQELVETTIFSLRRGGP